MKIVVQQHKHIPALEAIAATILHIQDTEVFAWVPDRKPVFDMLDELHPDIIICNNSILSSVFVDAIQEYGVKLIIFGMCSPQIPNLSLMCLDVNTPQSVIDTMPTSSVPVYIFKPASNIVQFRNITHKEYNNDILYISDHTSQQNPQLPIILSKISSLEKYKIKVCGGAYLPIPEYIGIPTLQQIRELMSTTKIVLDIGNQIIYDCAISKSLCLSNTPQEICPYYKDMDEMLSMIEHFIDDDKHRKHFIKMAYKSVITEHTYFHRMADIFNLVDLPELSKNALSTLNTLL